MHHKFLLALQLKFFLVSVKILNSASLILILTAPKGPQYVYKLIKLLAIFYLNIYTPSNNFENKLEQTMKIFSSLKSAKSRDKNCKVVRRKGKILIINKKNPRMKAKQG